MSAHAYDRDRFHVQTNNPTEEQLRKDELEEGGEVKGWLETCGASTSANCIGAVIDALPIVRLGAYQLQLDEVIADYFNDPKNYETFRKIRDDLDFSRIQGNRIPNLYPRMAADLFGVDAKCYLARGWNLVLSDLILGHSVQLCLKNPGHYIAAVDFDKTTGEIIYHDSWPARTGTSGFALRMKREEFEANVQDAVVVYYRRQV